jgi:hypothetical protein
MLSHVERTLADAFALEPGTLYAQRNNSCKKLPLQSRPPTLSLRLRNLRGRLKGA